MAHMAHAVCLLSCIPAAFDTDLDRTAALIIPRVGLGLTFLSQPSISLQRQLSMSLLVHVSSILSSVLVSMPNCIPMNLHLAR